MKETKVNKKGLKDNFQTEHIPTGSFRDWIVALLYFLWMLIRDAPVVLWSWVMPAEPIKSYYDDGTGEGLLAVFPGFKQNSILFDRCSETFRQQRVGKYKVFYRPHLSYAHNGDVDQYAKEAQETIIRWARKNHGKPIMMIGISMGGTVAMHIQSKLQRLRNVGRVDVVTLGSPLAGSGWGYVAPRLLNWMGGLHFAKRMKPNAAHIPEEMAYCPVSHRYHHVYSPTDWMVMPPETSVIRKGSVLRLDACPHNMIPEHPALLEFIKNIGNT